jgi:hypothetical protein
MRIWLNIRATPPTVPKAMDDFIINN